MDRAYPANGDCIDTVIDRLRGRVSCGDNSQTSYPFDIHCNTLPNASSGALHRRDQRDGTACRPWQVIAGFLLRDAVRGTERRPRWRGYAAPEISAANYWHQT